MNSFQPSQIESPGVVVSAVQIDPETRAKSPLTEEQNAVAAAAAMVVINNCGVTPAQAARADFDMDAWDIDGFPEPGPPKSFAISHIWGHAKAAARSALAKRWPDLDTDWISLQLDYPKECG